MSSVLNLFLTFAAIFQITNGAVLDSLAKDYFIIGGNTSVPGEAPYQVSLRLANMFHVCGGSILDTRWILTAAHCIHNVNPTYVVVGTNKINSGGTRYDIAITVKHLWYNPDTIQHDIALVKTTQTIVFTNLIKPILLPWRNVLEGEMLTLTGWGYTKIGNPTPNDLQIANVKVISNLECQNRLLSQGITVYYSDVCTFTGLGACYGDSGGPLVANGFIHALVSRGVENCTKLYPEINTRVYHYNIWIILTQFFYFWK